ncbi:MAG: hypothetical protein LBV54_05005 [Puniceicoccales bacterium]|jgi:membrane-bound ClpP family serine protease|nr:hypothetical protein [Puniceicoccales bacterium]
MTPSLFSQLAIENNSSLPFEASLSTAAVLLAGGLILLGLEIVLPGAICGIIGGILVISGIALAFYTGGMMAGMIALVVSFIGVGIGFWFYVRVLPNTRFGKRIFLDSAITGAGADAPGDDSLIGCAGATLTVLAPSGLVRVKGKPFEAVSRDGFLERGEGIIVLGRETLRLIVGKNK